MKTKSKTTVVSKPLGVFAVRNLNGPNTPYVWFRAGTATVNRDKSINVSLDFLPLDGKLHVRPVEPTK